MPFTPGQKAAKLFESPVALPAIYETAAGGDRKSEKTKADNISISTDFFAPAVPAKKKADAGTSRAYTLTRLKNERPDLFEKVCAKELTANRAATGKDGGAAEVEARRKGDAGEVIQFLREQSVINDGLLDTDTNRTLHIAEIHNTRKTACFRDGRCEVRRFSATFPHNRRKYRLKMGRQKSE